LLKQEFFAYSCFQYIGLKGKIQALFFTLFFGFFLTRTPAFGYFPDSVNNRFIVNIGLSGMGFGLDSGGSKPCIYGYCRNNELFCNFIYGQSVHIDNYKLFPKKLQVYVSRLLTNLLECSSMFFRGDRNMAEIIDFWEAKRAIEIKELRERFEGEYYEKQGQQQEAYKQNFIECSIREAMECSASARERPQPPRKKAKIISALPGETIPTEFDDLRPLLQRDGLILLSWAIWENYDEDGIAAKVNWIKSNGNLKKYCGFWTDVNDDDGMGAVLPDRKGDCDYREGTFFDVIQKEPPILFLFAPPNSTRFQGRLLLKN